MKSVHAGIASPRVADEFTRHGSAGSCRIHPGRALPRYQVPEAGCTAGGAGQDPDAKRMAGGRRGAIAAVSSADLGKSVTLILSDQRLALMRCKRPVASNRSVDCRDYRQADERRRGVPRGLLITSDDFVGSDGLAGIWRLLANDFSASALTAAPAVAVISHTRAIVTAGLARFSGCRQYRSAATPAMLRLIPRIGSLPGEFRALRSAAMMAQGQSLVAVYVVLRYSDVIAPVRWLPLSWLRTDGCWRRRAGCRLGKAWQPGEAIIQHSVLFDVERAARCVAPDRRQRHWKTSGRRSAMLSLRRVLASDRRRRSS